jgi:hypothetical protein
MNTRIPSTLIALLAGAAVALQAATPSPLRAHCSVGTREDAGKFSLHIDNGDCHGDRKCGSSFNNESFARFTGISLTDLAREGARLTATLAAEAGTFTWTGIVHDGELSGESVFTPDSAFVERMEQMGFSGLDAEKLQTYAFVNVESSWARSLQQIGVHGMTADNLIALRIFNVDPDYIHGITSLGYDLPAADQLIALKVQGVNRAEVSEIRALGYQPTLDELIQIRIFHITPDFIRRMKDRGFKNLTIAKLVQIRIFKVDE